MHLSGQVTGDLAEFPIIQVGAYRSPRILGFPSSWTTVQPDGTFRLIVPPGSWYLHAVGGEGDPGGLSREEALGSCGGPYGLGRPIAVCHYPVANLQIHLSPLWRDHCRLDSLLQMGLNAEQQAAVQVAKAALADGLAEPSIGEVAPGIGFGSSRLLALFRRSTGLSLAEYRKRLRLEVAKALLVETEAEILSVALEVGYATPAVLGRLFREYTGLSPSEFRSRARAVRGARPVAAASPEAIDRVRRGVLEAIMPSGPSISGEVAYSGPKTGAILYVMAFSRPDPSIAPVAWSALGRAGRFTLYGLPPGRYHLLACYCHRRMQQPGDYRAAFAWGRAGEPVTVAHGEQAEIGTITLVDGDQW